jgi:hypothetical protein
MRICSYGLLLQKAESGNGLLQRDNPRDLETGVESWDRRGGTSRDLSLPKPPDCTEKPGLPAESGQAGHATV